MNHPLDKAFARLEALKEDLKQAISHLDDVAFKQPEAPGKWSLSQVLMHLIQAEESSLNYLQKKILGIDALPKAGLDAAFRLRILYLSQALPLKFKAPAVVAKPPGDKNVEEIFACWEACRADLRGFLENFPEDGFNRLIFKHPVAGKFTLFQCLKFFEYHIIHHKRQIRRVLDTLRE
jgi:uncharacterized damage-inducible protein DinB